MKKRAMTLLEIMIVIFIIGIIGSVVGYNMKGSLEKGKAFKTEHGMRQVEEILMLEIASNDKNPEDFDTIDKVKNVLKESELARNPEELTKDGWGQPYEVSVVKNEIKLTSKNFERYNKKHKKK